MDNPYVAVIARKLRNLRKKYDKILAVEAQSAAGKKLDEEQLGMLSSKQSIEKSLSDLEALKTSLEEVAKQQVFFYCSTIYLSIVPIISPPTHPHTHTARRGREN